MSIIRRVSQTAPATIFAFSHLREEEAAGPMSRAQIYRLRFRSATFSRESVLEIATMKSILIEMQTHNRLPSLHFEPATDEGTGREREFAHD